MDTSHTSMSRMGSGTSWLPDAAPMRADHFQAGAWTLMLHYAAFGYYDNQGSKRGDNQIGSINWAMLMASHTAAGGELTLRTMFSAEPATVGARGYPLLLQTGESYNGVPLHDRQHPHDLFMELAALYEHPITSQLGLSLYLAPVGEPAIGPVAFMHRPSAVDDPFAPISHHWQDATHISFGVITAGLFTHDVKLEGSIFNGREPDQVRTNFDYRGRSLDSYAGRATINPGAEWSLSASYAYLKSPEALEPNESEHRVSASVLNSRPLGVHGNWSSTLVYGANKRSESTHLEPSVLVESTLDLDGRNTIFGRAEYVQKNAGDLVIPEYLPSTDFDVESIVLGYTHDFLQLHHKEGGVAFGIGASVNVDFVPTALRETYGTRTPSGVVVFFRVRPTAMNMSAMIPRPPIEKPSTGGSMNMPM